MNDLKERMRRQQLLDIMFLIIFALIVFGYLCSAYFANAQKAPTPAVIKGATVRPQTVKKAVWLTPARRNQLRRIKSKPRITASKRTGTNTTVYTWTNGNRTWQTTESTKRVLGKKATSAWQTKLDEERQAKKEILNDLKAIAKGRTVSKSALDNVIQKAERRPKKKRK